MMIISVVTELWRGGGHTVKTQIKEPCAMSLELPPLVRSGVFCFF